MKHPLIVLKEPHNLVAEYKADSSFVNTTGYISTVLTNHPLRDGHSYYFEVTVL